MPAAATAEKPRTGRYAAQRPRVEPPAVRLGDLRAALGLKLDTVLDRIEEELGTRPTRGALSAIENGHRGASDAMLRALEIAYGLRAGALSTAYEPRAARGAA